MNDKENNIEFTKKILKKTKQKNRTFIIKTIIVFVVFSLLSIYYFSPISIVSENNPLAVKTLGVRRLNKKEIIKISNIHNKSLFFIDKDELIYNLSNYPLIKNDSVKTTISPFRLSISLYELEASAKYDNKYFLTDMTIVEDSWLNGTDSILSTHLNDEISIAPSFINNPTDFSYNSDYYFYYLSVINHLPDGKKSEIKYVNPCDSSFFYYYVKYHEEFYRIKITHLKNDNTAEYSANEFFSDEALESFEKYFNTNDNYIDETINDETIQVHPLVCGKFFDENNKESIYNSCNEELINNG